MNLPYAGRRMEEKVFITTKSCSTTNEIHKTTLSSHIYVATERKFRWST